MNWMWISIWWKEPNLQFKFLRNHSSSIYNSPLAIEDPLHTFFSNKKKRTNEKSEFGHNKQTKN